MGIRKKFETVEELISAVKEYNREAPESKRITTERSYNKYYKRIEGAPSHPNKFYGAEWKRIGKFRGFFERLGFSKKQFEKKFETVEELISAVKEYNREAVESKRITSGPSYKKYYKEIEGALSHLPEFYGKEEWEKVGKWRGFFDRLDPSRKKFETVEELLEAVREYNRKTPESERITSRYSYNNYYKRIKGAPSNPNRTYGTEWEKVGKWPGFFAQLRSCEKAFH